MRSVGQSLGSARPPSGNLLDRTARATASVRQGRSRTRMSPKARGTGMEPENSANGMPRRRSAQARGKQGPSCRSTLTRAKAGSLRGQSVHGLFAGRVGPADGVALIRQRVLQPHGRQRLRLRHEHDRFGDPIIPRHGTPFRWCRRQGLGRDGGLTLIYRNGRSVQSSIATTASSMQAVATQPSHWSGPRTAKAPMMSVRAAASIITAMIGTARTPLTTALQ